MSTQCSTPRSLADFKSDSISALSEVPQELQVVARPLVKWIRTSFVKRYINKLSNMLTKAVRHAETTAELDMLSELLVKEFQECESILYASKRVSECGKQSIVMKEVK